MLTPTKMTKLQNNEVVDLYTKLNHKLTKSIIERMASYGDLSKYSKSEIKTIINEEKKEILKDTLKETRNLYQKSTKGIDRVFKELRDDLYDS